MSATPTHSGPPQARAPRRSSEQFVRHPRRLTRAFRKGEITPEAYLCIGLILDEAYANDGEALFWISELRKAIRSTKSTDTLLRHLKAVRPKWIDFEIEPRQTQKIVFRPTGAAVRENNDASAAPLAHGGDGRAASEGPDLRQSRDALRQTDHAEIVDDETAFLGSQLPQRASELLQRREELEEDKNSPCVPSVHTPPLMTIGVCADCGDDAQVIHDGATLCVACGFKRMSHRLRSAGDEA